MSKQTVSTLRARQVRFTKRMAAIRYQDSDKEAASQRGHGDEGAQKETPLFKSYSVPKSTLATRANANQGQPLFVFSAQQNGSQPPRRNPL